MAGKAFNETVKYKIEIDGKVEDKTVERQGDFVSGKAFKNATNKFKALSENTSDTAPVIENTANDTPVPNAVLENKETRIIKALEEDGSYFGIQKPNTSSLG